MTGERGAGVTGPASLGRTGHLIEYAGRPDSSLRERCL